MCLTITGVFLNFFLNKKIILNLKLSSFVLLIESKVRYFTLIKLKKNKIKIK